MVVRKLAPNVNRKIKVVRQGCVWPGQSKISSHPYTQTHSHHQLRKKGYATKWTKQALCSDEENLRGLNHERIKLTASKQVLQPHTTKKENARWGVFQTWIVKKHQSLKREVVLGIYKSLDRCFTDLQHSYSSSEAGLTEASPSRPVPQTVNMTCLKETLIKEVW